MDGSLHRAMLSIYLEAVCPQTSNYNVSVPPVCAQDLYKEGVEAYNEEDFLTTIQLLERALEAYYSEAEKCETLCESAVESKVTPDLYMTLAGTW